MEKKYIEYFKDIKDNQTEFDFDDIFYFVNNHQRVKQIENQIVKEMKNEDVIIPPIIEEYKNGFLYLANLILKNSKNRKFITEYSNEWIVFLMTEIASEEIQSNLFDPLSRNINKKINLAKEYIKFIYEVEEYEKGEELLKIKSKWENIKPEMYLISAYERYIEKRKNYTGKKFFDRISAICELRDFLKNEDAINNNFMILIEDYDEMEPIYKTIIDLLEKKGIKIIKINKEMFFDEKQKKFINIYHCMTPLDEAEIVGFKIKKILQTINPENIAVVVYGNDNANAIRFVLEKYGISYAKSRTLLSNTIYKLFKAIIDFILFENPDISYFIKQLIGNDASKYKIYNDKLREEIHFELTNIVSLKDVDVFEERVKNMEKYDPEKKKKINEIIEFIKKRKEKRDEILQNGFKNILNEFIEQRKIKRMEGAEIFAETIEKMDKVINNIKEINDDVIFKINTSLNAIGDIHYELEEKNKTKFDIVFLQDQNISKVAADYYFICGLDSKIEKRPGICGTYSLINELKLPTPEQKRQKMIQDILDLIDKKNCAEINLSYSGFDFNNKEKGISTLIRTISKIKKPLINHFPDITQNESLLRAVDLFEKENEVPAVSYLYLNGKETERKQEKYIIKVKEQKLIDVFLNMKGENIPAINSNDFSNFAYCPNYFYFDIIYNAAGFEEKTISEQINYKKGRFWHSFFKELAEKDEFLKFDDEANLKKIVKKVCEDYLAKNKLEISYFEKDFNFFEKKMKANMDEFIANELERRKNHKKPIKLILEKEFDYEFNFKDEEEKDQIIKLNARIDRIDYYDDKVIIWDYKTGNLKYDTEYFYFLSKDKEAFHNKTAAQIAFYRYVLKKKENITDKEIYGGIIFLNGKDNLKENDCRIISNDRNKNVDNIVEETLMQLYKFLNQNVNNINFQKNDKCYNCKFKYFCPGEKSK